MPGLQAGFHAILHVLACSSKAHLTMVLIAHMHALSKHSHA